MLVPVEQPGKCLIENILERDNKLAKGKKSTLTLRLLSLTLLVLYALRCVRVQVQIQSGD